MFEGAIMNTLFVKDKAFYRQVIKLSLPIAFQQIINLGVNLADQIMIGSFGEHMLSAVSLANNFYFLYHVLCLGIGGGACVLSAQYWGAEKKDLVNEVFTLSIRLTAILGLCFGIFTYIFPGFIMSLYTNDPLIIAQGIKYLEITSFIFIIHGTAFTTVQLLRTTGVVRLGLVISIISLFVNIGANYVLIFGHFGAPRLEVAGAAYGTLIARAVEFAITFAFLFIFEKELAYKVRFLFFSKIDKAMLNDYFLIGLPVIISDALLTLGSNVLAAIMGRMGPSMVSAYSITNISVQISTVFIQGISAASSIITGINVGKGESDKALREGYTFFSLSVLVGIIGAFIIFFIQPFITSFYNINEETLRLTKELGQAVSLVVVFQCVQSVMTKGVLRGGGDTKFLMVADILFLWLASIPLGFLAGLVFKLDPSIVYVCLRIDFIIKSIWCFFRLRSKKWIHTAELIEQKEKV